MLDAYPDWTIPAHVIAIIPTADRSKATVKVRVGIDQKDPRILPDMGVRVSFLEEAPQAAAAPAPVLKGLLVPASAVVQRAGKNVVFASTANGRASARSRRARPLGTCAWCEGLERGTRVVRTPPCRPAGRGAHRRQHNVRS